MKKNDEILAFENQNWLKTSNERGAQEIKREREKEKKWSTLWFYVRLVLINVDDHKFERDFKLRSLLVICAISPPPPLPPPPVPTRCREWMIEWWWRQTGELCSNQKGAKAQTNEKETQSNDIISESVICIFLWRLKLDSPFLVLPNLLKCSQISSLNTQTHKRSHTSTSIH